jgi:hypothetical protein
MIHRERSLPGRFLDRPTLSPLVPMLWLLSLNLAGFGVVQGVFNAGVWFGVLGACALLGSFMYGAALRGRRS